MDRTKARRNEETSGTAGDSLQRTLERAELLEQVCRTAVLSHYEECDLIDAGSRTVRALPENGDTDEEILTFYHVPVEAYEKALQIIKKYDMASWNSRKDCFAQDGKLYVCKFSEGPDFTRVSSDSMPKEGKRAFAELYRLLSGYTTDKYLAEL